MRIGRFLYLLVALCASVSWSQSPQVDPTFQINWLSATGSGAPSSGCPYAFTNASYTSGNATISLGAAAVGIIPNEIVTGTGIPSGTSVTGIKNYASGSITISANPTATETGVTVNFYPLGRPYTDTTNNFEYVCSLGGWIPTASGPVVSGNSFTNPQSVTFSLGPAAGTGGSAPPCRGLSTTLCSPNYGNTAILIGTSPTSGDLLTVSWSTAFGHYALCEFQLLDNTTNSAITNQFQDLGALSTTSAAVYLPSAPTSGHTVTISYLCW